MSFYIYSAVLPVIIIAIVFWFFRPLNFQSVAKALLVTIVPLVMYISIVYVLQMGNQIDAGWAYWTLVFFFIPYLVMVAIFNLVAWNKRRRA